MAVKSQLQTVFDKSVAKIVLIYAAAGFALNYALDGLFESYADSQSTIISLGILKSSLFILVTAVLLYLLLVRSRSREKASSTYNRILFEESIIGLALVRTNGELVDVNPAFAKIIGHSVEETLQLSYWQITPEKYAQQEQAQLESMRVHGSYGPYEKEYIHKDGHLVNVRLRGMLLDVDGEQMIWSSVEDISASKREEKTREQQRVFRDAVLDCIDDGIVACDQDGKITYSNRMLREFFRAHDTSLIPEEWTQYYELRDPKSMQLLAPEQSPLYRALKGETFVEQEIAVETDSQEKRILLANGRPLLTDSEEVLGGVVSYWDVTHQRKLQREEDERQQQVTEFNEALGNLINNEHFVLGDFDSFLEPLTEEISRLLQVSRVGVWKLNKAEDAVDCVNLWNADEKTHTRGLVLTQAQYPIYFEALLTDRILPFDDAYRHESTKEFTEEYFPAFGITSMLDAPFHFSGKMAGIVCLEHTGPKRIWKVEEKAFLISIVDLLSVITESSHRLALEARLHRSKKMDALGKLSGGIAHDYNNMLGVIMGYVSLLESSLASDEKLSPYVSAIRYAGERGAKLTNKLLTVARKSASDEEVLVINTPLLDQKDLLAKTLTARISLSIEADPNLWPVKLSASDLDDVVLNISINAMHAIEGTGSLTIATSNVNLTSAQAAPLQIPPGDYVMLTFKDSGAGMEPAELEKIFDPFYTTKGDDGTGLGLAQVYGFVGQCGGAIHVESAPSEGSVFSLYFPRFNDGSPTVSASKSNSLASETAGTETILVVDDEEALLRLQNELLTRQGYKVLRAPSAEDALTIMESEHVDLLLTDAIMAGMDGYELASIVQKRWPQIKIQMVSGYSFRRSRNAADKELIENLLAKPFNLDKYFARIRELLDEAR